MGQFHWDPDTYRELMRREVPEYDELQARVGAAARGVLVSRVLDLGTGTGETALAVRTVHPGAALVGIDASEEMLARARSRLGEGVELSVARLEEPLPAGPFDLVVSVLAVHHLDGAGKADLFRRVFAVLAPGGRFVLGDVVVPEDAVNAATPIDDDYDKPDTVADQLRWLRNAGFAARVEWTSRDLAVVVADR